MISTNKLLALAVCASLAGAMPPGTARAQSNPYLAAGKRLYQDLEYESALEQFKKAASMSSGPSEDIEINLYLGILKFELGDNAGAESDFKTALALSQGQAQLPGKVSPKLAALFQKARADIIATMPLKPAQPPAATPTQPSPVPQPPAVAAPTQTPTGSPQPTPAPVAQPTPPQIQLPTGPTPGVHSSPGTVITIHGPADGAVGGLDQPAGEVKKVEGSKMSIVWPIALLSLGAIAGGGGTYFGLAANSQINEAKGTRFQSDADGMLNKASSQAMTANIMFGTAAAAGVAGLITLMVSLSD